VVPQRCRTRFLRRPLRQNPSGVFLVVSWGGDALGEGVESVAHEVVLVLDEERFDLDDAGVVTELLVEFLETFAVASGGLLFPVWWWGCHP
jgi:hypothetical protein